MKHLVLICFLTLTGNAFAQLVTDGINLSEQFEADTARVEQQTREFAEKDYSTLGMIETSLFYEEEYDKLLNKYYKLLYNSLDDEGKKVLKATQLNWIKLRDSEKLLVNELYQSTYEKMGGGTIWRVIAADARADITRRRVIELYNYLMFDDIGGR